MYGIGRVEAFSDGVIAVAITLLVLDLRVPEPDGGEDLAVRLLALWPN
jgi:Predicted integral membrane protein